MRPLQCRVAENDGGLVARELNAAVVSERERRKKPAVGMGELVSGQSQGLKLGTNEARSDAEESPIEATLFLLRRRVDDLGRVDPRYWLANIWRRTDLDKSVWHLADHMRAGPQQAALGVDNKARSKSVSSGAVYAQHGALPLRDGPRDHSHGYAHVNKTCYECASPDDKA